MRTSGHSQSHLTNVPIIRCRSNSVTRSHAPMSRTSSVCSADSTLPPSALRRGKFDTSSNGNSASSTPKLPVIDLSIIHAIYGEKASLYDVLRLKPTANDTSIRKAYLRQGRKALLDHVVARGNGLRGCKSVPTDIAPKRLEDVPDDARKKFQAISIAYEILSKPTLRREYDKHIMVGSDRIARGANSVRWNPYVEEKIIDDSHPDEHSHRRRRRNQNGWLYLHLQRLDEEAEMFLNGNFLDELDESIASMTESIGTLIRQGRGGASPASPPSSDAPPSGPIVNKCHKPTLTRISQDSHIMEGGPNHPEGHPLRLATRKMLPDARNPSLHIIKVNSGSPHKSLDSKHDNSLLKNVETNLADFLESPCSVVDVEYFGTFVAGVVGDVSSSLANSFSGLLDGPVSPTISPAKQAGKVGDVESKRLNEQLREGFGEPFYNPPSPSRPKFSLPAKA